MAEKQLIINVESNSTLTKVIEMLIEKYPIKLHTTILAEDGLRIAMVKKPALVLIDLESKGKMSGMELISQLKEMKVTKDIPVVVMSSKTIGKNVQQALSAGAMEFISKPFEPEDFLRKLLGVLIPSEAKKDILKVSPHVQHIMSEMIRESVDKVGKKNTILVLDESDKITNIISYMFEKLENYKVLTSNHIDSGLRQAMVDLPDLIILDISTKLQGLEPLKQIKRMSTTKNIPVMIVSGDTDSDNVREALNLGAADFIAKPFPPDHLRHRVDMLLEPVSGVKVRTGRSSILVIDHNDKITNIISYIFEKLEDYKVFTSNQAEHGLKLAKSNRPDLIILDISPELNGLNVLKQLKQARITQSIPVMILSKNTDSDSVSMALSMGAVDYVAKPFPPDHLRERVQITIDRS